MTYPYKNYNGKNRPQSKEWQDIRAELMQLKTQFNLTDDEFRPLSPTENHQGIEKKMIQTFCQVKNGKVGDGWLWQSFKLEKYSVYDLPKNPETYLSQLIEENESIWLGATTTYHENTKIWWYEGKILPIQKVLGESHFFEEFYFLSKKFKWLLCINHHDVLTATGKNIPNKLQLLEQEIFANKGS